MKVFISADIEGVAGVATRDEVLKPHPDYAEFQIAMSKEVASACEAALESGATQVLVKDAHATGRNILANYLPKQVQLIRGWSGHPHSMMQEVEQGFDAALFIGYHSGASVAGNPLSHTMNSRNIHRFMVNNQVLSEFHINRIIALSHQCPTVFVSGDEALCELVKKTDPAIETYATFKGVGNSIVSAHPHASCEAIFAGVSVALKKDQQAFKTQIPNHFSVKIEYLHHTLAYKNSFYPGAKQIDDTSVLFETDTFFDVLRFMKFCI